MIFQSQLSEIKLPGTASSPFDRQMRSHSRSRSQYLGGSARVSSSLALETIRVQLRPNWVIWLSIIRGRQSANQGPYSLVEVLNTSLIDLSLPLEKKRKEIDGSRNAIGNQGPPVSDADAGRSRVRRFCRLQTMNDSGGQSAFDFLTKGTVTVKSKLRPWLDDADTVRFFIRFFSVNKNYTQSAVGNPLLQRRWRGPSDVSIYGRKVAQSAYLKWRSWNDFFFNFKRYTVFKIDFRY